MTDYNLNGTIGLDIENAPQLGEETHPATEWFANASFAKILLNAVLESKAGNHVNENVIWMDAYHNTNAESLQEWNFTASVANTTTWSETKLEEKYNQTVKEVFETLYDLFSVGSAMMDCEPPTPEDAADTLLWDFAADCVWYKFVWTTWHGGRTEELVGNELAKHWGVTEWIATTPELEENGIENPEPRGIDLYFPEMGDDGITVQVKKGDGGIPRNCDADVLARYHEKDAEIVFEPL